MKNPTFDATDIRIIKEAERRMMLKEAELYEKEAKQLRAAAARNIQRAEEFEREADQNRSIAEGIAESPQAPQP